MFKPYLKLHHWQLRRKFSLSINARGAGAALVSESYLRASMGPARGTSSLPIFYPLKATSGSCINHASTGWSTRYELLPAAQTERSPIQCSFLFSAAIVFVPAADWPGIRDLHARMAAARAIENSFALWAG
jgi:hypothetical protein